MTFIEMPSADLTMGFKCVGDIAKERRLQEECAAMKVIVCLIYYVHFWLVKPALKLNCHWYTCCWGTVTSWANSSTCYLT